MAAKEHELVAQGLPTQDQVRAAASTLVTEIQAAMASAEAKDAQTLAGDMEWSARTLAWSAGLFTPKGEAPESVEAQYRFTWGLTPHYNAACYWADQDQPNVDRAIASLVLAGETSDSEWLFKDPQLRTLRKEAEFRTTFGAKPRTDLLLLMPFATYAEGLRKQGLTSAHLLAGASRSELRAAGIPFGLMAPLKRAGAFATSMPEKLVDLQIEVLDALDRAGYRFAIPPPGKRNQVKEKIIDSCLRFNKVIHEDDVTAFLGG